VIGDEQVELALMIRADSSLALTFWSTIRSDWALWPACVLVGFAAAVLIIKTRRRGREVWTRLRSRERILVRCLAIAALWCMLVLLEHDRLEASWMTAAVTLFWGAYALFSRTVDGIWSRMRKR
jgi:protein-S-isoprenylcysteine O-methyltransferase Ste14